MAGEWLKFEASTPEKQEVFAITVAMGWPDPDLTVGKLLKIWRWFDQQTIDGNAANVTFSLLDHVCGVTGFAEAMCAAGWLVKTAGGVVLPNFDRHNGKTAKERALTAKRVAKHKTNAKGNDGGVSAPLPKEEKRREDSKPTKTKAKAPAAPTFDPGAELAARGVDEQTAADWLKLRKGKRAPVTLTALEKIIREADLASLSLERALALCCARGWTGFEARWVLGDSRAAPGGAAKFNPTDHVNRNRSRPQ